MEVTQIARGRGQGSEIQDERDLDYGRPRDPMGEIARIFRCRRGDIIDDNGQPNNHCYRVISGAAKYHAVLPGGRTQILDLLFPGDFFDFAPSHGDYRAVEAAVNDTVIAAYPRTGLLLLAATDRKVAQEVAEMAVANLGRLQRQLLVLGRRTAEEKVGAFLLEMTQRAPGKQTNHIALLISRYDIADYLGVSVETVSRSISRLKRRHCIDLSGPRDVSIVNHRGLEGRDSDGDNRSDRHFRRREASPFPC